MIDNCSTDGTREFLELFARKTDKNFKLILNSKNKGFNFSCDKLILSASSKYLWIIGGQDKIIMTRLNNLFLLLESIPTLVICNASIRDEATNEVINESIWGGEITSSTFRDLETFFAKLGGPCQSISCNIFNVSQIKKVLYRNQITHLWGYLERLCDLIVENEAELSISFTDIPLVEVLIERDGWQKTGIDNFGSVQTNEFGAFFTTLELAELANNKFYARKRIRNSFAPFRDIFLIPKTITVAKSLGLKLSRDVLFRTFRAYKSAPSFWLIGLPLMMTPHYLASHLIHLKGFVHLLRKVFRIKRF